MNPKPLVSLNHFTVPVGMSDSLEKTRDAPAARKRLVVRGYCCDRNCRTEPKGMAGGGANEANRAQDGPGEH
ncbi:MAG: hypothetical protein OHK0044_08250 [Burkholderiaceae bacterium]